MKPHLKSSFFYSLLVSLGPIVLPYLTGSEGEHGVDVSKILITYLIAVVVNTFIIAFITQKGHAMMKSFTDPKDGPIS